MKATLSSLGAALAAVVAVSPALADGPAPAHPCFFHVAPDACGPGYYAPNEYGLWFGPNHDVYPPCGPFNGLPFHFGPKEEGEAGGPGPIGPYPFNGAARPGAYGAPGAAPQPYRGPAGVAVIQRPYGAAPANPYARNVPYGRYLGGPYGPPPVQAAPYGPYAPYGRMIPFADGGQVVPGPISFPTHPWARSPRDFFMVD